MFELDWQAVLLRAHGATGHIDDVRRLRGDLQRVVRGEVGARGLGLG